MKKTLRFMMMITLFVSSSLAKNTWTPIIMDDIVTFVKSEIAHVANNRIQSLDASSGNDKLIFTIKGDFSKGYHYSIYLDADSNPNTGYSKKAWHMKGMDYLLQDYSLYKHKGDGYHWVKIGNVDFHATSTTITLTVDSDQFPHDETIRYTGVITSPDWNKNYPYSKMKDIITEENKLLPVVIIGTSTVHFVNGITNEFHENDTVCSFKGWGQVIGDISKDSTQIYNYARAGSSAGSFKIAPNEANPYYGDKNKPIDERFYGPNRDHYWAKTKEKMEALGRGILLIQYGGNDKRHLEMDIPLTDVDGNGEIDDHDREVIRERRKEKFKENITFYVEAARDLNFTPILITSPGFKKFDSDRPGEIVDWRWPYPDAMKAVGNKLGVRVLDLNKKTKTEFKKYGTQDALDKAFGKCYNNSRQKDDAHRDWVHYEGDTAKIIAGWVRDLACEEKDSVLCKQLIP